MSIFKDINKVSKATDGRRVVRVGVFIPVDCQLLDAAGVDIFGSMSYEYLSSLEEMMPKPVIDSAPSVEIHYIGSVQAGEGITSKDFSEPFSSCPSNFQSLGFPLRPR